MSEAKEKACEVKWHNHENKKPPQEASDKLERYKKAFEFIEKYKAELEQCCGEFQWSCHIPHRVEGPWSHDVFAALYEFSKELKKELKKQKNKFDEKLQKSGE